VELAEGIEPPTR